MRYVISLPASRDLQAIADYFAQVNIAAGERFLDEFDRRCQQIVSFPNSGRSYGELRANLRGLPLDGYIILYQVMTDRVEIVRVVHGKRDLRSLFTNS